VQNKPNKVGLYFGSFNPVHIGHLIVGKTVLDNTDVDEVWFVVSPVNPAKARSGELEDEHHRLEMVRLAIADEPGLHECDIEFELPRPSYTKESLEAIRDKYPDIHFSVVAGTDTHRRMGNYWKKDEYIMDHHDFIVYPRALSKKDLRWKLTDKAHAVATYLEDVPEIDISATYIRNKIKNNQSIKFIVTDEVIKYISDNNLFEN
jgi:nicotinate-nucleotide adenylyltransferase